MNEQEYWLMLERRVCREFAGMPDRSLRYLWCDGLVPATYEFDSVPPRILGCAWIGDQMTQSNWTFELVLPRDFDHRICDWSSVLPSEDSTNWMAVDTATRRLEIEPGAAVPDR